MDLLALLKVGKARIARCGRRCSGWASSTPSHGSIGHVRGPNAAAKRFQPNGLLLNNPFLKNCLEEPTLFHSPPPECQTQQNVGPSTSSSR